MDRKKIIPVVMALAIVATISVAVMPVQGITPPSPPESTYFQDITPAGPPWLNYNNGGVRILLTSEGDSVGRFWDGAWALAYFSIASWESQTGESWPYQWRTRESVAREIQVHCWVFDTTERVTTISFNGW